MKGRVLEARAIAKASYKTVFSAGLAGRIGVWVLLVWIGQEIFSFLVALPGSDAERGLWWIGLLLFSLITFSVLAVRWYRFFWGKEEFGSLRSMLPKRRDWRFALISFVLIVLALVAFCIPVIIGRIVLWLAPANGTGESAVIMSAVLIGMVAFIYVFTRLSLALPIVALDTKLPYLLSWGLTNKNGWKMVATLFLSCVPFAIANGILHKLAQSLVANGGFYEALLIDGLGVVTQVLSIATGAGATTLIYKALSDSISIEDGGSVKT